MKHTISFWLILFISGLAIFFCLAEEGRKR